MISKKKKRISRLPFIARICYRPRFLSQTCTHICELFEFMRLGIYTYKWCISLPLQKSPIGEKISILLANTHTSFPCAAVFISERSLSISSFGPAFPTLPKVALPHATREPYLELHQQTTTFYSALLSFFFSETTLCHYICNSNVRSRAFVVIL